MNIKALVRREFIGLRVKIVEKGSKRMLRGEIIDETKNMLTLVTGDKKRRKFIKTQVMIIIGKTEIDGALVNERPEDRIRIRLVE